MSEAYKIKIHNAEEDNGILDAVYALSLAVDFLEILKVDAPNVVLDIKTISRESPFTLECIPVSTQTPAKDYSAVEQNAIDFEHLWNAVTARKACPSEVNQSIRNKAKCLFGNTSMRGYHTEYDLGSVQRLITTNPESAQQASDILEHPSAIRSPYLIRREEKARELGSVDGEITEIKRHRETPVLLVYDRGWQKVIQCELAEMEIEKWKSQLTAADAWSGKRISVRGELMYGRGGQQPIAVKDGYLTEVYLSDTDMSIRDLIDPDFTDGLSTKEFLKQRWEGANHQES